jgi:hypothetical protein
MTMLCYKDKTYCAGDGCARHPHHCRIALTDEIRADAKRLGLLISERAEPRALTCWTDQVPAAQDDKDQPSLL